MRDIEYFLDTGYGEGGRFQIGLHTALQYLINEDRVVVRAQDLSAKKSYFVNMLKL